MGPRPRRRIKRIADVDYDRKADRPVTGRSAGDGERIVELDDAVPEGEGAANYEEERPPHHGG